VSLVGFKAVHFSGIDAQEIEEPGFKGVEVRWLITKDDDAKNFAMRLFAIKPKGRSAQHSHSWEHEVFVLEGQGSVLCCNEEKSIGPGYVVFIPPNTSHHFKNTGDKPLRFLCLIPHKK
jgi:quercetin dioxygenase-like cupin family protein